MSLTIGGVWVSIVGVLLGSYFTQGCASEIIAVMTPVIAAIPGALMTITGRKRLAGTYAGSVGFFGLRK